MAIRERQMPTNVSHAIALDDRAVVVTAVEAAALLGVNERTIRRAIERGELAATRQGRGFAISAAALDRYRLRRAAPDDPITAPEPEPDAFLPLAEEGDLDLGSVSAEPVVVIVAERPKLGGGLPASLTSFIGRERDVAAAVALLTAGADRLVTLTGPGGTGKSRLALEVAAAAAPHFADGAAFVGLASIQDVDGVLPAILLALGRREEDKRSPLERLIAELSDRQLLLLLDNLEHVVAAGPDLVDLLIGCPGLTVLATSRVPLRVTGERRVAVSPLGLPKPGAETSTAVGDAEAIALFVDRARAADGTFALTDANAAAVAAIVRRLDGLPLAIELAAARSAVLPPGALLARLERRLPLLTGGPRDQPDRLRTMRGAIAWSEDLLGANEQTLLRHLAVFVGGVSLAAAEAVGAGLGQGDETPGASAVNDLATLLDGGLLQRGEAAGEPRFGMLETVREYALDRLTAAGEETAARRAHASWCLSFIEAIQPALWAVVSEALLHQIEAEHDNLQAALAWSIEAEPETALRLASGLSPFWMKRSHWTEGRAWLERALASGDEVAGEARAFALGRLGAIAGDQGDFTVARSCLLESLAIAERLGSADIAARAHRGLGIVDSNQSAFKAANEHFAAALAAFRTLEDRPGIARCLNDLGLVAERQGDHDQAIAYQEEALPISRAMGDEWQVCVVLGNLGGAYYDRGDYARGEALCEEAHALAEHLGDTFGIAVNRYNLGCHALRRGEAAVAAGWYRDVLGLTEILGERHLVSRVIDRVGATLHLIGKPRPAARLFGAAAALREALGDTLSVEEAADLSPRFAAVRTALGAAAYDATLELGRSLPYEVAIAEAAQLAVAVASAPVAAAVDLGLTTREVEVLRKLADGNSDKEIADALFVARPTASKHVAAIISKLGVESRTAAVAFALRHHLI